jgi:hypothetical protein
MAPLSDGLQAVPQVHDALLQLLLQLQQPSVARVGRKRLLHLGEAVHLLGQLRVQLGRQLRCLIVHGAAVAGEVRARHSCWAWLLGCIRPRASLLAPIMPRKRARHAAAAALREHPKPNNFTRCGLLTPAHWLVQRIELRLNSPALQCCQFETADS